jgi:hypothetical protein
MYYPMKKDRFVFDRLGNMAILSRSAPVWGSYVCLNPAKMPGGDYAFQVPSGKFMYHTYMAEGGSWQFPADEGYLYYGRGEDTNIWPVVTFDEFVMRMRMKWLQKFGIPLTVLYHPDNQNVQNEVIRIADSIIDECVVTIPRPPGGDYNSFYHLEFIEPPTQGHDAFAEFTETYTRTRIEKIILGGANQMQTGDRGSYGASVNQRDAGPMILFKYDAKNIDETINAQLFPYIVNARYPGIPKTYYPKSNLVPEEIEDRDAKLETLGTLASLVPVRKKSFYAIAAEEEPKADEETVYTGNQSKYGAEQTTQPGMEGMGIPGAPPEHGNPSQERHGGPSLPELSPSKPRNPGLKLGRLTRKAGTPIGSGR